MKGKDCSSVVMWGWCVRLVVEVLKKGAGGLILGASVSRGNGEDAADVFVS